MNDNIMTLDGLIGRLTELREEAGRNCPVVFGKSFDPKKELMKLTMVCLDSFPQGGDMYVAMLAEDVINESYLEKRNRKFERNCEFDVCYDTFRRSFPNFEDGLTDSSYYDLAEWYDEFHDMANNEYLSEKAYEFADYVWYNILKHEID